MRLSTAAFEGIHTEAAEDFCYRRRGEDGEVLVVLNYSGEERPLCLDVSPYEILLNNSTTLEGNVLKPYQALVLGGK